MLDKNRRNFRNSYNYCRLSVSYTSHLYMVQDMNMKHFIYRISACCCFHERGRNYIFSYIRDVIAYLLVRVYGYINITIKRRLNEQGVAKYLCIVKENCIIVVS